MVTILWADDEIEMLKPYILFLAEKGYEVDTSTNGHDAIEMFRTRMYDIVFLDENMPGLSGLETLMEIDRMNPSVPVVMITKSEEENIMDMAIGNKMADYLIKPVNPNQILMTLKKHVHKREILSEQTTSGYRNEFGQIGMQISDRLSPEEWYELYRRLIYWDIKLDETDNEMHDMLHMQMSEANNMFARFIKNNYLSWLQPDADSPMMSHEVFKKRIFPMLDRGERVFLVVIDNFRYDQWKVIQPMLGEFFQFDSEEMYFSILPTATQYARNAIFGGLLPLQIKQMFPELWVDEDEDEGRNLKEAELLGKLMERYRRKEAYTYHKVNNSQMGERLVEQLHVLAKNQLNVCVLNFVDMLSHARTESQMIRELANTEAAFRSLAYSWFRHSSAYALFKGMAERGFKVMVTTDHGTVHVNNPVKVVGDKNTNVNLRYKVGKALAYDRKDVFEISEPAKAGLPNLNVSSKYIFAMNNDFFAYPNNYNCYVSYYKDTFQHGGVSMEEMLIPFVTMSPKQI